MIAEPEITNSVIESIQLVALQRVSGHEMSRVDFNNEVDAVTGLEDLRRFGHAGYVISRGKIAHIAPCAGVEDPLSHDEVESMRKARELKAEVETR